MSLLFCGYPTGSIRARRAVGNIMNEGLGQRRLAAYGPKPFGLSVVEFVLVSVATCAPDPTREEDRPNGPRTAVVTNELWKTHFGADPKLVGRTLDLNGEMAGVRMVDPRFPDHEKDVCR